MARHFSDCMEKLYAKPRESHTEITQRDMDRLAMQRRFGNVLFHLLRSCISGFLIRPVWPEAAP